MATRRTATNTAIRFQATLHRPASPPRATWLFLVMPKEASRLLPSRGACSVEGTINGASMQATFEPDGTGGHWLKLERALRRAGGGEELEAGDIVELVVTPLPPERELEPAVPRDFKEALAGASATARQAWSDITPKARREWIQWFDTAKQASTRTRRIAAACDMLDKGKRRPCCFDRSGIYGGGMSCPTPAPDDNAPPIPRATRRDKEPRTK